jgi:uncharacterized protein
MTTTSQRLAFAFLIVAAALVLASSAGAQFAGGHSAFDQRPGSEAVQFRDFFGGDRRPSYPNNSFDPFGGDRRSTYPNSPFDPYGPPNRRPPVYEATKPPAPRKVETPSAETVVVIGDSLADWLGYGLEQVFAEKPEIGIVRKIRPDFGLARDDARLDAPVWVQVVKDLLATEKPSAIVVMLGVNDRLPLRDRAPAVKGSAATLEGDRPTAVEEQRRPQGANSEFHTDKWAELYSKRIDDIIAALMTKGVPIIWVGLPAVRGTKSTSDMSYLDELYRARAEKAGITYVDIWDGFVDEQGRYTQQGPDFEGQTRRLRTYDGVHFTKAGAEKLGHYVEQDLRRVWISHVVPVALPGPEEQTPAKGATVVPPLVGPVVPLNAIGDKGGDLLGAAGPLAERPADPVATRVLNRGDAIAAPPGRADDFSWPRADTKAGDAADVGPAQVTPPPGTPPAKGSARTNSTDDEHKNDTSEPKAKTLSDAKNPPAQSTVPPKRRLTVAKPRRPGEQFDGALSRPPLPLGPGLSNSR